MINFSKENQLVPAIIQDATTKTVLMLGYMNQEALDKTKKEGKVTFFSRSKNRLWTKGETSGNFLQVIQILEDCDNDSLLIKVNPHGPTCHTGTDTCWAEKNETDFGFISHLEKIIEQRKIETNEKSYIKSLYEKGTEKIAQKVGEEAVELVIEALGKNDDLFLNEASDLFFHYLILLHNREFELNDIVKMLEKRQK
jgi:phosphoribosyl-AMP cyclohydrolase / phosphoribosyl-ATP pyrophosphohydrolase